MARGKSADVSYGIPNIKKVQAAGAKGISRNADALVMKIVEILRDRADRARLTQEKVADLLNARGLRTGLSEAWTRSHVRLPLQKARVVLKDEEQDDRKRMDTDFGRFWR